MDVIEQLRDEEGVVPHVYQDHLGYWTIGCGRLVDERKGGGLSEQEIDLLLSNDVNRCTVAIWAALPWFGKLNEPRQAVLVGMAFQMGTAGLFKFTATLAHVEAGRYESAAANMLKSLWARQTPDRAKRMAEQMRTGVWQKKP